MADRFSVAFGEGRSLRLLAGQHFADVFNQLVGDGIRVHRELALCDGLFDLVDALLIEGLGAG